MTNSADPDQLASEEANWSVIYIACKSRAYPGSAGQGLKCSLQETEFDILFNGLFSLETIWMNAKHHSFVVCQSSVEKCPHKTKLFRHEFCKRGMSHLPLSVSILGN